MMIQVVEIDRPKGTRRTVAYSSFKIITHNNNNNINDSLIVLFIIIYGYIESFLSVAHDTQQHYRVT